MVFARNALASGRQACFFTKKAIAKGKVNKERFSLAGNAKVMLEMDSVPKVRDEVVGP